MKITGNIFSNNYWLMKFAPLALALAAVVIFFCNLYAHIWNGAIIYLPLLFAALGRWLKKTACGWSDKGATKIARIILKRFTNNKAWEDYWQEKMNCVGNVVINIGNYKCFSQNLGQ